MKGSLLLKVRFLFLCLTHAANKERKKIQVFLEKFLLRVPRDINALGHRRLVIQSNYKAADPGGV